MQLPLSRSQKLPLHLGDLIFQEKSVLGTGYSGEVKKVEDDSGHSYALKVSNDKTIRFCMNEIPSTGGKSSLILPEASEFERLRKLYMAGVPVPRPYGFQVYCNADGVGNTAMLMDLIKGSTLRDWLSEQLGGVTDKLSGRSIHPAFSLSEAIARIDVASAVIGSLVKLRQLGFFADFKPRNVMIREQRIDKARYFNASLVDIGGVVMYQDVSTNSLYRRPETSGEEQSKIFFHPVKDRFLIETTCSYLSPELAILIAEYDYWRGRLPNHYFATRNEALIKQCDAQAAERLYCDCQKRCSRGQRLEPVNGRVIHSYLQTRKNFHSLGVLSRFYNIPELGVSPPQAAQSMNVEEANYIPHHTDIVTVSEKSTVFTMGLILSELFGGKRTGLTALTRIRAVNDVFASEHHNAEFRIAMEWEHSNTLFQNLTFNNSPGPSTRCPNSNESRRGVKESDVLNSTERSTTEPDDSVPGFAPEIPVDCYFELYRRYAYPNEGFLRVHDNAESTNCNSYDMEIGLKVKSLLDKSLRANPLLRPTLAQLLDNLQDLRRLIASKFYQMPTNKIHGINKNALRIQSTTTTASAENLRRSR